MRPKKIQEAADCCSQEQLPECIICGRSSKRGGTVPVPACVDEGVRGAYARHLCCFLCRDPFLMRLLAEAACLKTTIF